MLEKIDDNGKTMQRIYVCRHPEHDPPKHIVLPAGTYRHTCPACDRKIEFRVVPPTW